MPKLAVCNTSNNQGIIVLKIKSYVNNSNNNNRNYNTVIFINPQIATNNIKY